MFLIAILVVQATVLFIHSFFQLDAETMFQPIPIEHSNSRRHSFENRHTKRVPNRKPAIRKTIKFQR